MGQEVEDFYGVYLLYCLNPKYKGRTYIGYTVNPNRRIKQHNTGCHAGGAYRTNGKGPWEMVLIVHGFPNDISGLRFEWAWQNPHKSRRLRSVTTKSRKENAFQYRWRIVCNMLRTAPWSGLCLTVRWLKQDYRQEFPQGLEPPLHMPVVFGLVISKKVSMATQQKGKKKDGCTEGESGVVEVESESLECDVCLKTIKGESTSLSCLLPHCNMAAHIICLAQSFLCDESKLLPVEGQCPKCHSNLLWGDLIRQRKGCYQNLSELSNEDDCLS